jgi:hypothetical protein
VLAEQIRVSRPVLLEKSRRPLDVGEEKVTGPAGSSRALTARSCHRAGAQRRWLRAARLMAEEAEQEVSREGGNWLFA